MTGVEVLAEPDWLAREAAHAERMRRWTVPHQERRSRGEKHPVLDFLFTYYSYRPSHLERWQPGPGVALAGPAARRFLDRKGYVDDARTASSSTRRASPRARRGRPSSCSAC